MKKISNAQARSIIRRASLIGSDISVIFIPADEAKQFKDHTLDPQGVPSPIPPEIIDSDVDVTTTKPITGPTTTITTTTTVTTTTTTPIPNDGDSYGFDPSNHQQTYPTVIDSETLSATLWGPPRTVTLYRHENVKSLGISIVGGKLDFSGPGNTIESCISGIFIKHVLPDSPAGRNGTLKTGDRILEVNGHDLRDASHDRAVEIIRAAQSPVHFIVQSLLDPSNPTTTSNNDYSSFNNDLSDNIPSITSPSHQKILSNTSKYSVSNERRTEEELIKQYGHLNGDLLFIDIKRNPTEISEPLGLSLIGHRDPSKLAVFVCDIQPGSLLDRDHRIFPGDQLLEVNGEILLGKAHSAVTPIIKSIKADTLNFVVLRNPNAINDMALNNQHAAARIRASALASPHLEHSSKISRNTTAAAAAVETTSPSLLEDSHEQPMTNDASHHSDRIPGQSPDVIEKKENNNDDLTQTNIVSSKPVSIQSANDDEQKKTVQNAEEKLATIEERPTFPSSSSPSSSSSSSSSSNRITRANDVQSNNNKNDNVDDVSSFNHNISSNATITAFHSISSDVSSSTRRSLGTSLDQATSSAYENDESLLSQTSPLLSAVLMHEQANHANDKNREEKTMNNDNDNDNDNGKSENQRRTSSQREENLPSRPSLIQSNELTSQTARAASPSDINTSSPPSQPPAPQQAATSSSQNIDDRLRETSTMPGKNSNGSTTTHRPLTSSSSSSSSSLSISTPSSNEHVTKKLPMISSTQSARRPSMSNPGVPTTLILSKDQKGSFGLTVTQRDHAIWIQSVQPHGSADQQDIRAGDQLIQINGTPVDALKFTEILNLFEHSNSNQIHLTCIPYREPQAQPVVVNINQAESLPMIISNDTDSIREDDPRSRPIVVGQETLIEIDRGQSGLGLSVVGGLDTQLSAIIVHDIYDGCAAQRDGRLHVGDQILEVNTIDLRAATHEEAIQALRQSTNIVRILVLRGKVLTEMTNEQEKFDIINIELIKKSGKGLGFSIIGRRHGYGVFISHILEGGCAEKDGRLMSGDLILEVNGQDLRTAAYEHVAYTLKTLPHGRVTIKIGRLKPSARSQTRQNSLPNDRKNRSRSSSSNIRRSSANKVNDR